MELHEQFSQSQHTHTYTHSHIHLHRMHGLTNAFRWFGNRNFCLDQHLNGCNWLPNNNCIVSFSICQILVLTFRWINNKSFQLQMPMPFGIAPAKIEYSNNKIIIIETVTRNPELVTRNLDLTAEKSAPIRINSIMNIWHWIAPDLDTGHWTFSK